MIRYYTSHCNRCGAWAIGRKFKCFRHPRRKPVVRWNLIAGNQTMRELMAERQKE